MEIPCSEKDLSSSIPKIFRSQEKVLRSALYIFFKAVTKQAAFVLEQKQNNIDLQ